MARLLAACGGFLLAVLWMDLMFDVQVWGQPDGPLPERVLASIAGYYARVTTDADPMGRLVGMVMAVAVLGSGYGVVRPRTGRVRAALALAAVAAPVALAGLCVVPNAVELGTRTGSLAAQSELARAIFRDHVVCALCIALFIGLQLSARSPAIESRRS